MGEGIGACGGVQRQPLATPGHRLPAVIQTQATEHVGVGAALLHQGQRVSFGGVVLAAATTVGTHQPEPLTIARQALNIGFTLRLAARQAKLLQLQGGGFAVVVIAQPPKGIEASPLIPAQPDPAVTSGQGGEVLHQISGVIASDRVQLQRALALGCRQGQIGFTGGHGESGADPASVVTTVTRIVPSVHKSSI